MDDFPLRLGNRHIDECTDNINDDNSISDDDLLSPLLLIHTSRLRSDIEEWAKSWRELAKKPQEDQRQTIILQGHTLCCRLERELEAYYRDQKKQFVVRLQARPIFRLKLMNEYSVDWPIWTSDIGKNEYQQHLTPRLQDRLAAWAANFNANFHTCLFQPDGWEGWQTEEQEKEHWREGRDLEQQLQEQLSEGDPSVDWVVYLHLWEK